MSEQADLLPLTVPLPETAADLVVIYDQSAALRFAVVERVGINRLEPARDEPGSYLLLDPRDSEGRFGVYVGKAAPGGVRSRLLNHVRSRDSWTRAVIVQRGTRYGFNSAQVGWLEGRLYDLLQAAEFADLSNSQRPRDETLPPFERAMLEQSVLPVRRLLRLLGYDPATPEDPGLPSDVRRSRQPAGKVHHGISLSDLVAGGLLTPGTALVSTNSAWPAVAIARATGIEFNGATYPNPSAAASAAKDGGAANGWDFSAVEGETGRVPLSTLRSRFQAGGAEG